MIEDDVDEGPASGLDSGMPNCMAEEVAVPADAVAGLRGVLTVDGHGAEYVRVDGSRIEGVHHQGRRDERLLS